MDLASKNFSIFFVVVFKPNSALLNYGNILHFVQFAGVARKANDYFSHAALKVLSKRM